MKGSLTFPVGGIHPPDRKSRTASLPVTVFKDLPEYIVPLSQHLGTPADAVVAVGDYVEEGAVIGRANGYVSVNIHAPVHGSVSDIREQQLASGQIVKAVVLKRDEAATSADFPADEKRLEESTRDLIDCIRDAGIVGMGGAGFPAHVKLSIPGGYKARILIINGTECEPYLCADHRVMLEEADRIKGGIRVLTHILGITQVYIGIEKNKPDAIELLKGSLADAGVQVVPLKVKYPQGDEKQLIKAILGKEVPSGKLPIELGAIVVNVSTTAAIYDAVIRNKPLYERVVTVAGRAVERPGNYLVKVGTPIRALLEECAVDLQKMARVVVGGPMMGFSLLDLDTPVTKGTSGVLALSADEISFTKSENCIACGRCITVCPMCLSPTQMYKFIDHLEFTQASGIGLMDCKECGCCAYTCPARIPLVNGFKGAKFELRRMQGRKK